LAGAKLFTARRASYACAEHQARTPAEDSHSAAMLADQRIFVDRTFVYQRLIQFSAHLH
jgi:hypothetical protein